MKQIKRLKRIFFRKRDQIGKAKYDAEEKTFFLNLTNKLKPNIVIGMHRSGTAMLVQILKQFNVHMGYDMGRGNEESVSFLEINEKLFDIFHAAWDWPYPLMHINNLNRDVEDTIITYIYSKLCSQQFIRNYGIDFRTESLKRTNSSLFGWKDPRTTYTLPIWLKIFPNAKIIHIYRNGIDVAQSLRKRELRRMKNKNIVNYRQFSVRCLELENGLSLWSEYTSRALIYEKTLNTDNFLAISYEALLIKPQIHLKKLQEFLGLRLEEQILQEISLGLNADRRHAFLQNQELIDFYLKTGENNIEMKKLGYINLIKP
ncbi:MAG: sulfotransferase [Candidatus Hodarchaeota archaeon]